MDRDNIKIESEMPDINAEVPTIDPRGENTQKTIDAETQSMKPTRLQKRLFLKTLGAGSHATKDLIGPDGKSAKQKEKEKRRKDRKKNHAAKMARKKK